MPTPAEVRADLTDILVAVVACDRDAVVDGARLEDLGVDSLAVVEVADELGRRHDRYLSDQTVDGLVTVGDAVRAVVEHDGSTSAQRVATTLHHPAPSSDRERSRRVSAMSKIAGVFIVLGAIIGGVLGLGGAAIVAATGIGGVELPPITAPSPTPTPSASPTPSAEPTQEVEEEEEPEEPTLSLSAEQVAPGERFGLSGTFPELGDGEVLQVQAREDGGDWEDFPVTAITGPEGRYETQVYTSRAGEREFRMLYRSGDVSTEPVPIRIG